MRLWSSPRDSRTLELILLGAPSQRRFNVNLPHKESFIAWHSKLLNLLNKLLLELLIRNDKLLLLPEHFFKFTVKALPFA